MLGGEICWCWLVSGWDRRRCGHKSNWLRGYLSGSQVETPAIPTLYLLSRLNKPNGSLLATSRYLKSDNGVANTEELTACVS